MAKMQRGLAFSLMCDLGFAVGIVTHDVPRIGSLIWVAEPTFDEEPTVDDVIGIRRWRWPVFFSVAAAVRRKIVNPIGVVVIPVALEDFPLMRSRDGRGGRTLVRFVDGSSQPDGVATDPTIPRYTVVNDTRLKEMLVSGWRPERDW